MSIFTVLHHYYLPFDSYPKRKQAFPKNFGN